MLFVVLCMNSYCQKGTDWVYCELVGTAKVLSKKVTVEIDYGQEQKFFERSQIIDETTGKPRVFNSMVDGLNYMGTEGWEFTQAYVVTVGNTNVYHWLLKRKKDE